LNKFSVFLLNDVKSKLWLYGTLFVFLVTCNPIIISLIPIMSGRAISRIKIPITI